MRKTNKEQIQEFNTKELAEYLFARGNCDEYCYGICACQDECEKPHTESFCIEQISKWLESEAV